MLLICVSCLRVGKEAQEAYNHPTCEVKKMFSPWLALSRHAREANTCLLEHCIENTLMGFWERAALWLGQAFSSTHCWGTKVRSKRLLRKVLTGRCMAVCDSVACAVVLVALLSVCCCCGRWKCVRTRIVFPDIWPETELERDWWGAQHAKFGARLHSRCTESYRALFILYSGDLGKTLKHSEIFKSKKATKKKNNKNRTRDNAW